MKAPAYEKGSRIPVYTSLRQKLPRGCSAPTAITNGFIPNGKLRHVSTSAGEPGNGVRDFFKQRQNINDVYPLQNIKHHYQSYKSTGSPTKAKPAAYQRGPPPKPMQPPPLKQRNGWNKSNPLPALNSGNDNISPSYSNETRENSESSWISNGSQIIEDRHESIETIQRRKQQEDVLALIAQKEEELQRMKKLQILKQAEEQKQKERDRLKRSRLKMDAQNRQESPREQGEHSRKWSSEEENLEPSPPAEVLHRKPAHFRRRSGPRSPVKQAQQQPSPREDSLPAKGGYKMEIAMSPPPPPRKARQPSPPPKKASPREPSPPPVKRKQPPQKRSSESPKHLNKTPQPKKRDQVDYDMPLDATYEPPTNLAPCRLCGRKFAEERLQKHEDACRKAQAKRKVFDPVKMRTQGTEAAQYVNSKPKKEEPKKPKKDWRKAHEELLKTLRYNKQVSEYEKNGGNLADLPPPPPTEHPDYVECPHCSRKFNEGAAERHIPKCKDTKSRPAPVRGGGKRR